jgi:hypothetical protein
MKFRTVLIVTYGRTGSTLLQGILNTIPGCVIRGENYGFCYSLFQAWSTLSRARKEHGGAESRKVENPWFGAPELRPAEFLKRMRPAVLQQLAGEKHAQAPAVCLGFKEIRYLPENLGVSLAGYPARLTAYLDFLARLFPDPAIIFLTRNLDEVVRSAWWRNRDPGPLRTILETFEGVARSYRHDLCATRLIDYKDVVANGEELGALFEFLGTDHQPEAIAAVLQREHSFGNTTTPGFGVRVEPFALPDWMLAVDIDPMPKFTAVPLRVSCSGVALRIDGSPLSLELRSAEGAVVAVEWGLPSPLYGKRFAQTKGSDNARFRSSEMTLAPGQHVDLVVRTDAGSIALARLACSASAPEECLSIRSQAE